MVALHCSQLNYRDLIIDKDLGRPAWASPLCLQTLGGTVVATAGSDHRAVWIRPSTQREHHHWPAALAFADSPAKVYKSRYSSWHGPFHRSVYYYYYINGLGGACQITSAQSASRRENWNSVFSQQMLPDQMARNYHLDHWREVSGEIAVWLSRRGPAPPRCR